MNEQLLYLTIGDISLTWKKYWRFHGYFSYIPIQEFMLEIGYQPKLHHQVFIYDNIIYYLCVNIFLIEKKGVCYNIYSRKICHKKQNIYIMHGIVCAYSSTIFYFVRIFLPYVDKHILSGSLYQMLHYPTDMSDQKHTSYTTFCLLLFQN